MPSCEGKSARKSAINTEVSSCTSNATSANHRQAVLPAAAPGAALHYTSYIMQLMTAYISFAIFGISKQSIFLMKICFG